MSAQHSVTVEWSTHGGVSYSFTCHAPLESSCHAFYSCSCEEWNDMKIENGRPYHTVEVWSEIASRFVLVPHFGVFKRDECNERDWFENSEECLRGEVTLEATGEWDGNGMLFTLEVPR